MNLNNNKEAKLRGQQKQISTKNKKSLFLLFYLILLAILLLPSVLTNLNGEKEITWQQFEKNILSRRAVEKILIVNNEKAEIYIKKAFSNDPYFKDVFKRVVGNVVNEGPHYRLYIGSAEVFERKLEEVQKNMLSNEKIDVQYVEKKSGIGDVIAWLFPFVLLFILWSFWLSKSGMSTSFGNRSIFRFGKSDAALNENEKSTVTFDDVAGLEEAEMEVREIVDFLKNPEEYTRLGAKIPKGVILVGLPGTGKTLLAKAVAGEAQVPFFSISGSAFIEMFVGVGASRVRDLFKSAKERAPSIIFIDEIDAIGKLRSKGAFIDGNAERDSTLNQLLNEMDGFGTNSGVIVLAATNRADILDPALLRPGRFDRHIYLELPNAKERKAIFKVHLKGLALNSKIDVVSLAGQTPGFSGADIANVCNEAALIAARQKKDAVDVEDFFQSIDRIVAGAERKSKIISPEEKEIIAYHQAGHAVVSWILKYVDPLIKVSIIPRGKSLGSAWYLPEEKQLRSQNFFTESLDVALGGRAAEEIKFGEVSSGALDDLEKATKGAYIMVSFFGFNQRIGNVSFYDSSGQKDISIQKPFSEETGKIIDEEVRNLISKEYDKTKKLLSQNRNALVKVAELLLKKEIIYKEDLEAILGKRGCEEQSVDTIKQKSIALPTV